MSRLILVILSVFFLQKSYCQTEHSGYAVYRQHTTMAEEISQEEIARLSNVDELNAYLKKKQASKRKNKLLKLAEFRLSFDKRKSLFQFEEMSNAFLEDNDIEWWTIPTLLRRGESKYFIDTEKKIKITKTHRYGEDFIVHEKLTPISWERTRESKQIGAYICYKAVALEKGKNNEMNTVVAWYAPDIPINVGPMGFWGLPGLILELQLSDKWYVLKALDLEPLQDVLVEKPKGGIEMSRDQFNEIRIKG